MKGQIIGTMAALLGAALWGFSGACAQYLLAGYDIDPIDITAVRTLSASLAFVPIILLKSGYRKDMSGLLRSPRSLAIAAVFSAGLFGSQFTFSVSVMHSNAGTATVLQSLCTVFVMGVTCIIARRLPHLREFLGLICGLFATWLIATGGSWDSMAISPAGLLWGIINALSVTLYLMAPKRLYERFDPIPVIAAGMFGATLLSLAVWGFRSATAGIAGIGTSQASFASVGQGLGLATLDPIGWAILLLGIGILGTWAAFSLYLYGVSVVGSVKGALFGLVEPASAMVLAAVWLATPFLPSDWAGLLIMAAMIVLISVPSAAGVTASGVTASGSTVSGSSASAASTSSGSSVSGSSESGSSESGSSVSGPSASGSSASPSRKR